MIKSLLVTNSFKLFFQRFVKPEVIDKCSTPKKLVDLDVNKTEIYLPVEKVDVGFVVRKQLVSLKSEKKYLTRRYMSFEMQLEHFL